MKSKTNFNMNKAIFLEESGTVLSVTHRKNKRKQNGDVFRTRDTRLQHALRVRFLED